MNALKMSIKLTRKSIAIVISAEANIFSVSEDTKIPIAINDIPRRISAIKLPIIKATLGSLAPSALKMKSGIKLRQERAR